MSALPRRSTLLAAALASSALLLSPLCADSVEKQSKPKKVFAHYMMAIPRAGGHATVEDYKAEVRDAQALGIDGFALNSGGWTVENKNPSYKERTRRMYQAALELDSGFELFISADFATRLNFGEFVDMVETFRDHPNQFRREGKPVISTFRGEKQNLTQLAHSAFQGERAIMLVPFYFPNPPAETPDRELAAQVLANNETLPGFFLFGAAGTPERLSQSVTHTAGVWHEAGKLFMAPVTPYYRGRGRNFRAFESHGFEGMALAWETAINTGSEWVEIVTWNDWNEASYICPLNGFTNKDIGETLNWLLPHEAYQQASRYYMDWFRNSEPPTITEDEFYYFYRLHPKTTPAPDGRFPLYVEALEDRIYATVFLSQDAAFTISCGGVSETFELSAGVHHVSVPMTEGTPVFTLARDGGTIFEKTGEYSISPDNNWAWFNYFAGSYRPSGPAPVLPSAPAH